MSSTETVQFQRLETLCTSIKDGDWIETKDQSSSGFRLLQIGNIGIGNFKPIRIDFIFRTGFKDTNGIDSPRFGVRFGFFPEF